MPRAPVALAHTVERVILDTDAFGLPIGTQCPILRPIVPSQVHHRVRLGRRLKDPLDLAAQRGWRGAWVRVDPAVGVGGGG